MESGRSHHDQHYGEPYYKYRLYFNGHYGRMLRNNHSNGDHHFHADHYDLGFTFLYDM